jgi:hypothetical protein
VTIGQGDDTVQLIDVDNRTPELWFTNDTVANFLKRLFPYSQEDTKNCLQLVIAEGAMKNITRNGKTGIYLYLVTHQGKAL